MNALYALNKPLGISSNHFLMKLKKQHRWKKCGYSGTLDPLASGLLIVGVGAYTKLFPYLDKQKKIYEATLWLGARSETLDREKIDQISFLPEFDLQEILKVCENLKGVISYVPPKFSAKHIQGQRAYDLARSGKSFVLQESQMEIFDFEILAYCHPFLSFRVSVSEGAYIRSLGQIIAHKLGCEGSLSSLKRIEEGGIKLPLQMKSLDVLECLKLKRLKLEQYKDHIFHGKKFLLNGVLANTMYLVVFKDFFSIIEVNEKQEIQYRLNRIPLC